jgi:hypothetical protein
MIFFCPKYEHQIDEDICLARQSYKQRKCLKCKKGKEIRKAKGLNPIRSRKEKGHEN